MKSPAPQPLNCKWWFVLGRETKISAAEIAAVLNLKVGQFGLSAKAPLLFCPQSNIPAPDMIKKLGGTIKIAQELGQSMNQNHLFEVIKNELKSKNGKMIFGLSIYGSLGARELMRWGKELKSELKEEGYSVRYIPNKEPTLSSATVDHNHLIDKGTEFIIYEEALGKFSLAKTIALQPYAEFSKRDFDRPGRDDKSGMLPPKLAMMMLNLSEPKQDSTILDPFCGSGTIITEAMIMGYRKIIGSDISERAIEDTQKNIEWIKNNLNITCGEISLYNLDVKNLGEKIEPTSIDRIVAEPFMGKPLNGRETFVELEQQSEELKQLYIESFGVFQKILSPNGIIVFIFPRFHIGNKNISTNLVEKIKTFGFKLLPFFDNDCLVYERPGQRVAREIWRFQKI